MKLSEAKEIFGIGKDSEYTLDQIQAKYKIMTRKFHPDKNSSADAEDKMKEINQARDILLDPKLADKEDRPETKRKRDDVSFESNLDDMLYAFKQEQKRKEEEFASKLFSYLFKRFMNDRLSPLEQEVFNKLLSKQKPEWINEPTNMSQIYTNHFNSKF